MRRKSFTETSSEDLSVDEDPPINFLFSSPDAGRRSRKKRPRSGSVDEAPPKKYFAGIGQKLGGSGSGISRLTSPEIDYKRPRRRSVKPRIEQIKQMNSNIDVATDNRQDALNIAKARDLDFKRRDMNIIPLNWINEGTVFFVTVNSNRRPDYHSQLTYENTLESIRELECFGDCKEICGLIKHNTGSKSAVKSVSKLQVVGCAEMGTKMERLHAHIVIGIEHDLKYSGGFQLKIDAIANIFKKNWGVERVYINVKAAAYSPITHNNMIYYLDAYQRNVRGNEKNVAPRAFFNWKIINK